jgi:phosphoglycolate/pyridoxal phosphate phosphatase family enzyme
MDGVLYRGSQVIEGAPEAVKKLKKKVKKVFFTTNNSTLSRRGYVKKLRGLGVESDESQILTSAYAAAVYLKGLGNARVLPIGERGLREELLQAGLEVVDCRSPERATHVVAGLDRRLTYGKIVAAAKAISAGAVFVATNTDAAYPTEAGLLPGAGATVGAIVGCTGRSPDVVLGKPSTFMLELGMRAVGVRRSEVAVIGDRLDTDVVVAKKLKLRSILVLSGVSTPQDVRKARRRGLSPDFVFRTLAEVVS